MRLIENSEFLDDLQMKRTRILMSCILLALILPGGIGAAGATNSLFQRENSIQHVQHPLIYSPSSLSIPGSAPYVPTDIWKGYDFSPLYAQGINGSRTRIAIIDAYGDPSLSSDLSNFESLTLLPPATVHIYYPDGTPITTDSGWALETALDVEWAHAMAPAATIDLVVSTDSSLGNIYDAISYVANNLPTETALSMSFGLPESQYPITGSYTIAATHQLFLTITSHGTAPFASSGDNAVDTCCNVNYPASDPLVVAVGGTSLILNSTASYVSEASWSDSSAGSSIVFAKPSWQRGLGDSMRDIVDVSYDADPNTGVLVIQNGAEYEVGGTSTGSPQWAALATLASQASNGRFGAIASRLYSLSAYHDVTSGSDGYFSAGPGWDYPTGLGSPDATLLLGGLIQQPVPVDNSTLFEGLNITTTGKLIINDFNSTISGTVLVDANNSTNGTLEYARYYTLMDVKLLNQTLMEMTRFALIVPVDTFPLSVDISLIMQGSATHLTVSVTRRVDISGTATVNLIDVSIVEGEFNTTFGSSGYDPRADLEASGIISLIDVSLVDFYFNAPVFT
jgi:subtilase family serine protease